MHMPTHGPLYARACMATAALLVTTTFTWQSVSNRFRAAFSGPCIASHACRAFPLRTCGKLHGGIQCMHVSVPAYMTDCATPWHPLGYGMSLLNDLTAVQEQDCPLYFAQVLVNCELRELLL